MSMAILSETAFGNNQYSTTSGKPMKNPRHFSRPAEYTGRLVNDCVVIHRIGGGHSQGEWFAHPDNVAEFKATPVGSVAVLKRSSNEQVFVLKEGEC